MVRVIVFVVLFVVLMIGGAYAAGAKVDLDRGTALRIENMTSDYTKVFSVYGPCFMQYRDDNGWLISEALVDVDGDTFQILSAGHYVEVYASKVGCFLRFDDAVFRVRVAQWGRMGVVGGRSVRLLNVSGRENEIWVYGDVGLKYMVFDGDGVGTTSDTVINDVVKVPVSGSVLLHNVGSKVAEAFWHDTSFQVVTDVDSGEVRGRGKGNRVDGRHIAILFGFMTVVAVVRMFRGWVRLWRKGGSDGDS